MELSEAIKTRRSKRKYLDKDVPDGIIRKLIDCAKHAPYSKGAFTCEFIIVKDKDIKKKLSDVRKGINETAIMTSSALIVICNNKNKLRWIEDGIFTAANILLAAHSLGLGAVYTTAFNPVETRITSEMKKILNLPEDIMPVCIIPIGYPDPSEEIKKKELRNIDKMIHYEKW